jgi:hypothetical protein
MAASRHTRSEGPSQSCRVSAMRTVGGRRTGRAAPTNGANCAPSLCPIDCPPLEGVGSGLLSLSSSRAPTGSPALIEASLRGLGRELRAEAPELLSFLQPLLPDGDLGDGPVGGRGDETDTLFPTPDYDRHPYYSALARPDEALRARAVERFFESFSVIVRAEQAFAQKASRSGRLERALDTPRTPALAALEDAGIWRFRLSPTELNQTLERSEPAAQTLEARRVALPPEKRGVEGVLQLLAEHASQGADFEFYDGLLQNHDIYQVLEQYYGCPFRLLAVSLQINSGDDTGIARVCSYPDGRRAPSYYMHIDSAVGVVKILMYRTGRVTADTGAFRYVPGSHLTLDPVQRAIRKACDKAGLDGLKDEARAMFMALPPCLRRKANFGNDLLPEAGMIADALLAREIALEGEAGEGFLADINGAHRGNLHADPSGRREMFKFVLKGGK